MRNRLFASRLLLITERRDRIGANRTRPKITLRTCRLAENAASRSRRPSLALDGRNHPRSLQALESDHANAYRQGNRPRRVLRMLDD